MSGNAKPAGLTQTTGRRLEVAPLACRGCLRIAALRLQIGQIGLACATLERPHMVLHMKLLRSIQDAQQKAAQRLAIRTAESVAAPDFRQRMNARLAPLQDAGQSTMEGGIPPQTRLDRRHCLHRQVFVEVRLQVGIGKILVHRGVSLLLGDHVRSRLRRGPCGRSFIAAHAARFVAGSTSRRVQFGKDIGVQASAPQLLAQPLEEFGLEVRHLLFGPVQLAGDLLVRAAAEEQQFGAE